MERGVWRGAVARAGMECGSGGSEEYSVSPCGSSPGKVGMSKVGVELGAKVVGWKRSEASAEQDMREAMRAA